MAGSVPEMANISPCEEVRGPPNRFSRDAEHEAEAADPHELLERVSRALEVLEDLESADAIERLVGERESVRRCRSEGDKL